MQREIFIDTSKCMDDITSWYAVAKELKTCINFIHEAIESAYPPHAVLTC